MAAQKLQTAAVLTDPGPEAKFTVSRIPIPTPGPNELLVRLSCTSVCHSDVSMARGFLGPPNSILGHEGVGRVVAAGSNAVYLIGGEGDASSLIGRRIAVGLLRDLCGTCDYCLAPPEHASESRCSARIFSGLSLDGTLAQYVLVRARYAQFLPASLDAVPDEHVAPVMCGGLTAYRALKVGGPVAGSWVAVSGAAGGVGAFAVAYARAMGCRVVGLDVGEARRAYVLAQGAEAYVDATGADPQAEVKRVTGGAGANMIVVAAGVAAAYDAAMGMLAPFGTLVCVGMPPPGTAVKFDPFEIISYGYKIVGSVTGTRVDVLEALDFVKRGLVVPKVRRAQLSDIQSIIQEVSRSEGEGKFVIDLKDHASAL
ncbi:hypothetical protein MCOR27_009194 [Pyricularia oryzae]|uniref:alcohol dehydrogenase n=4 Tax=Pyricularia oryzae TaxID=318829 RepID=G4NI54_PYRO7|nr:uncharacterized protein MGG_17803 [Pyricularia oryzae 70-15]KAH8846379.1 hypothetical protein MCOR01_003579 [Pyricularia oryzae]EHA47914.1 hypothetical protein MGG_17803 [Pyricularia oryzae 70-15]KAH9432110.1 hypothetical protein MCOR02_006814 [Pyricularia oryzae]KAI6255467.1 hypothetical protein MCOR19_008029 [Pyricularia oryzae]KAI6270681.1 hypothetical protein MCOR27_009194 [Pyricularia oryzae]